MWILIIICVIVAIVGLSIAFGKNDARKIELTKPIRNQKFREFKSTGYYSTIKHAVGVNLISIDENTMQWFVMDYRNPASAKLHKISDILDVEILRDNVSVIKASTSDVLARGFVGGALFGNSGEIVGGATAQKTVTNKAIKLGVRVILSDLQTPMEYIDCMSSQGDVDKVYSLFVAAISRGKQNNVNPVQPMHVEQENTILPTAVPAGEPLLTPMVEKQDNKITIPSQINGIPLAYHYENVEIAIISNQIPDFENISIGSVVQLIQEKTNQFDENAISVNVDGVHLGYLYKGTFQDMANDYINHQLPISSYITRINKTDKKIEIFLGFYKIKLSVYDKLKKNGTPFETVKLTGSTTEDMQETIMCSAIGEEVIFEYDYEKEKYVATSGGEIGYLPKAKSEFMENEEDYQAFIENIEENDNGKYVVSVAIFQ